MVVISVFGVVDCCVRVWVIWVVLVGLLRVFGGLCGFGCFLVGCFIGLLCCCCLWVEWCGCDSCIWCWLVIGGFVFG